MLPSGPGTPAETEERQRIVRAKVEAVRGFVMEHSIELVAGRDLQSKPIYILLDYY
jgi:hypothetical protein